MPPKKVELNKTDGAMLAGTVGESILGGAVGGSLGGLVAGLLPSMLGLKATKRYEKRISGALNNIESNFNAEIDNLKKLTDAQFKLINENLITLTQTIDKEKINYLINIITTSVSYSDYCNYDSILLSRIIRDISSEEIRFITSSYSYKAVCIYSWYRGADATDNDAKEKKDLEELFDRTEQDNCLLFLPGSEEELIISGLVNLGVLVPEQLALGVHRYKYSDITVKLLVLLNSA